MNLVKTVVHLKNGLTSRSILVISLTWHLEWAAGLRAAGRVWEGGAARRAAVGRTRVAVGGRVGAERYAVSWLLRKRFRVFDVMRHVWLCLVQWVTKAGKHGDLGIKLAVPRHQDRRQNCI